MPLEQGKQKMPPPRTDKARDMREAVEEDAGETGVEDRDLMHGDGGTLGLEDGEDLNRDD
jgi:hypothetical protein